MFLFIESRSRIIGSNDSELFQVLDDNKKLCLSSGEIMKLTERQRMIFEVADLAVASPATVSRCGMVYLDQYVVGLPPLVNAWLKSNIPQVRIC